MEIKRKHEAKEDWFMPMFQTEEIKRRRAERMRRDAMTDRLDQAKRREQARAARAKREAEHQREVADAAASVAGGLTMAASLLGIAVLL